MKKLILIVLLIPFIGSCIDSNSNEENLYPDKEKCIKEYSIFNNRTYIDINNRQIPAMDKIVIDSLKSLNEVKYSNDSLTDYWQEKDYFFIYFNEGKFLPAVNKDFFTDLNLISAAREINNDTNLYVGKCIIPELLKFPRKIANFLLEAQIISTSIHIGSELCMISESTKDNIYKAEIKGFHTYYTNKKNTEKVHFAIKINLSSGEMFVCDE